MNENDCKDFLASFFKNNSHIILEGLFPGMSDEENQQVISDISEPDGWELRYKAKPGCSDYEFREYAIYEDGTKVSRWGEAVPYVKRPLSDFVTEWAFDLEKSEGQVAYVVLEDKEGQLHVGDYIGD